MDPVNVAVAAVLFYVAILFGVAFLADRSRDHRLLRSPLVYTLSISVYCTSWTFYGAVGSAARGGLEFATIYLGPTLVFLGAWTLLRKMLRIGRENNITSIADFISSRYGKSDAVAALVTVIAMAAVTPYIALQLKAVSTSLHVIGAAYGADFSGAPAEEPHHATAFWAAVGLAVFTILFGARHIDASERHYGVVAAIAVEALVKLTALIAVGLLAAFSIGGGPGETFAAIAAAAPAPEEGFGARWMTLIVLSAGAILCLPRQFQVTVVENNDERHLFTASWLFPLYLFLLCLSVPPIAAVGAALLPPGSNPDMFVLTMPIALERHDVALLAFLGGFSSATSMVIVSCIAVSTMISNHIVVPWALRGKLARGADRLDLRRLLLSSRRASIILVLMLGFLYLRLGATGGALASIGLIAFAGVSQVLPALIGALYWPRANRRGALTGLGVGFALWLYTLVIPELAANAAWWRPIAEQGLFGMAILRPSALFGLEGLDPLTHSVVWTLSLNTLCFILFSLSRDPRPIERLQSALFVDVFRAPRERGRRFVRRAASVQDLLGLTSRIVGPGAASEIFAEHARKQGLAGALPDPDDAFIDALERRMAASVGAASARAMVNRVSRGEHISLDELVRIADETARLMEYSAEVERKSRELEETARQLRAANERLRELDAQKDDFLSQVSHEVRTPMTSIRSFAEILTTTPDLSDPEARRFLGVIHDESLRLTRLLDEILDMTMLERGRTDWDIHTLEADATLERAIDACRGVAQAKGVRLRHAPGARGVLVEADEDRLQQVFINVLSNAVKYNDAAMPEVRIASSFRDDRYVAAIEDNGPGVSARDATLIFEKFARGAGADGQQGAGLGLAISAAIMARFEGELTLLPGQGRGARFRVSLPGKRSGVFASSSHSPGRVAPR